MFGRRGKSAWHVCATLFDDELHRTSFRGQISILSSGHRKYEYEFNVKRSNSPWFAILCRPLSTWRQTWSPSWTAPSTSPDTPDARRHRVPGCAQRHSGGPVFHVFHTPQCPWSSLHFMNRARAPSLGSGECFRTSWRHGTRCNFGSSSLASAFWR